MSIYILKFKMNTWKIALFRQLDVIDLVGNYMYSMIMSSMKPVVRWTSFKVHV